MRKLCIPQDWQPDQKVNQKAESMGMKPEFINKQLIKFKGTNYDGEKSLNRLFFKFLVDAYETFKKRSIAQRQRYEVPSAYKQFKVPEKMAEKPCRKKEIKELLKMIKGAA